MHLEQLWITYHRELLQFIKQRVNCMSDAEDILQDVFVKAYLHNCSDKDNPRAWLYQTTRTTIIDYYRTRKPLDPLPHNLVAPINTNESSVNIVSDCLRTEVERLPAHYRDAVLAVDFEGRSQQEVSESIAVPYPTLRSRVQRARKQLKMAVERCCHIFFDYQKENWNCEAKQKCAC